MYGKMDNGTLKGGNEMTDKLAEAIAATPIMMSDEYLAAVLEAARSYHAMPVVDVDDKFKGAIHKAVGCRKPWGCCKLIDATIDHLAARYDFVAKEGV